MVTGDSLLTALHSARACRLISRGSLDVNLPESRATPERTGMGGGDGGKRDERGDSEGGAIEDSEGRGRAEQSDTEEGRGGPGERKRAEEGEEGEEAVSVDTDSTLILTLWPSKDDLIASSDIAVRHRKDRKMRELGTEKSSPKGAEGRSAKEIDGVREKGSGSCRDHMLVWCDFTGEVIYKYQAETKYQNNTTYKRQSSRKYSTRSTEISAGRYRKDIRLERRLNKGLVGELEGSLENELEGEIECELVDGSMGEGETETQRYTEEELQREMESQREVEREREMERIDELAGMSARELDVLGRFELATTGNVLSYLSNRSNRIKKDSRRVTKKMTSRKFDIMVKKQKMKKLKEIKKQKSAQSNGGKMLRAKNKSELLRDHDGASSALEELGHFKVDNAVRPPKPSALIS